MAAERVLVQRFETLPANLNTIYILYPWRFGQHLVFTFEYSRTNPTYYFSSNRSIDFLVVTASDELAIRSDTPFKMPAYVEMCALEASPTVRSSPPLPSTINLQPPLSRRENKLQAWCNPLTGDVTG
jgi:hypothetical protein